MNAIASSPWYRNRWPWLLMLGPTFVVVAGAYATWLAKTSEDGLVADDYYKRGLAINRTLERSQEAAARNVGAIVTIDATGAVRATLSRGEGTPPTMLRLRLIHPTRAGLDRKADLIRDVDGAYLARIAPLASSRWLVVVETDVWRLPAVETNIDTREIRLGAAAR